MNNAIDLSNFIIIGRNSMPQNKHEGAFWTPSF